MLVIRQAQLDAFMARTQAEFERHLLRKLGERQPWAAKAFPEPVLMGCVKSALARLAAFGMQDEESLLRHLELVVSFGSAWEKDPLLAHVLKGLGEPPGQEPAAALERAWTAGQVYRQKVMGPELSLHRAALATLQGRDVETLTKNASRSQRDLMLHLAAMYPTRYANTPEATLFDLTRTAVEACRPFELLDRWAVVLVVEMMFLFGAGFLDDPLYAWAAAALRESPGADIDQRLARLLAAAQAAIAPRL